MKNSINVYWSIQEHFSPSSPLLATKPEPVISSFYKKHKKGNNDFYLDYTKCPAFSNEYKNTFTYNSLKDFIINVDPNTLEISPHCESSFTLRDLQSRIFTINPQISLFSDEPLEMSMTPSSLHFNDFVDNTNIFSGKYNIGKWFRPLNMDFRLKYPKIEVKRGDILFYLRFHTDKKINFIHFRNNEEIIKIQNSCLALKDSQPGYRFKDIYNFFLRIGYHKKLLKEIKKNITDLK